MNKNVTIPLLAILFVVIVLGFFWLKDTSKTGIKPQAVKVVSTELSQSDKAIKHSAGIQPDLSAILGQMTGQSAINEMSEAELLDVLFDTEASLKERQKAAFALAKSGGADILPKLEEILSMEDTPLSLKAAILEGLGYSPHPQAKDLIVAMLQDENDLVVRGAIKGLSATGNQEAVSILSNIMSSEGRSDSVIAEAALGLGKIDHPDAFKMLVDAYNEAAISENNDRLDDIISALGYRDITESGDFFKKIINSKTTDPSLRLAAIEAIQDSQGDTGAIFLSGLNDTDSEVRAEAAWALAAADDPGDISREIETYLVQEQDAEVRKRLYQALGNQENPDLNFINDTVYNEPDLDARLAGYDVLAKNISSLEDENLITQFNETAVPELQEVAMSGKYRSSRLSAVMSLKKANTKEANLVLKKIAGESTDKTVAEAAGI
jgi:HEAT repeat protein